MNNYVFKEYKVWDIPTRIFHWVNFVSVISLIFVGFVMLYKAKLGISGIDAKIALKELHVIIGYVFGLNLIWRVIWGFIGNKYARWSSIFPNKGFLKNLHNYILSIKLSSQSTTEPQQFLGHNPLGRIAIITIMSLLLLLMITGLMRAATDIYYPPFGSFVTKYIASSGVNPESISPYNSTGTDKAKIDKINAIRWPAGKIHRYSAYALMLMIFLHVFFVIHAELKYGGGLISAMITGKKILKTKPIDNEQ
ncbi:MAG: cytochrome b/b6 domain-containing protein [Pseudomonadota bacterium]